MTYVPANNFTGADSFQVTFTDARGATVNGTVNVTVLSSGSSAPTSIVISKTSTQAALSFQGTPNQSYQIQRSINLTAWTIIATPTANPSGAVTFTDTNPPVGKAFYRIIIP